MEKINEIVANNIAILRKKNRLSLEELGKLSGVSKSMLALIEKGTILFFLTIKTAVFLFFTWKWTKTAIGIPNPIYRELLNFLLLQKVL